MDAYDNHTFQPRNAIHRSDLAQAVSRHAEDHRARGSPRC